MAAGRGFSQDQVREIVRVCHVVCGNAPPGEATIQPSNAFMAIAGDHGLLWPSVPFMPSGHPLRAILENDIAKRAGQMAAAALEIENALGPRLGHVWLKGAAHLAECGFKPYTRRFMADLDLLVPADTLDAVTAKMTELGYRMEDSFYSPATNPHLPMFVRPGQIFGIEVHSRLLRFGNEGLLAPQDILARCETKSSGAKIPSREHRIAHLVAHAQIGSHRHFRRVFIVRDAIELHDLASNAPEAFLAARAAFSAAGKIAGFDAFTALAAALTGTHYPDADEHSNAALDWRDDVLARGLPFEPGLGRVLVGWAGEALRTLTSAERARALSAVAFSADGWRFAASRAASYLQRKTG